MAEETRVKESILLDEKAMEALESLMKMAAKLKESGLLDLLETMAEKYEELLMYTGSDQRVYHMLAALEAALNGMKAADPWKYKMAIEKMTSCAMSALDPEELQKVKPVKGLFSLLRALSDPNVAKGLGIMLYLAARLGACMGQEGKEG
ncbi:hypothetical protein PYJP_02290 [Pyrofollis japonicus]|uniref:DUF1641 domain-containing protein n=1 Tax=Pyrofollis japonicus TaxID=3060460 RepID=UPI00295A6E35|nr:DUF1641 domain-containing protein [Pyrofollis japonicus]BEP16877.1 hypothetical protein PYJP_02290 [Pyrofollis japonicus]